MSWALIVLSALSTSVADCGARTARPSETVRRRRRFIGAPRDFGLWTLDFGLLEYTDDRVFRRFPRPGQPRAHRARHDPPRRVRHARLHARGDEGRGEDAP